MLGAGPPTVEGALRGGGGVPRFAERLRRIDELTAAHERALAIAGAELRDRYGGGDLLAAAARRVARGWRFDDINQLIEDHNRWYPIERRLPVDPRTGEFVPVLGRSYRRSRLDARWAGERLAAPRSASAGCGAGRAEKL